MPVVDLMFSICQMMETRGKRKDRRAGGEGTTSCSQGREWPPQVQGASPEDAPFGVIDFTYNLREGDLQQHQLHCSAQQRR